ncbi:tad-like Flp pilus-assembly family protein [Burkholderia sp. MSHR3999]|uniref:TadG family pilus assembly protein n=1 Tax=Burkholderia sp. MSHR3999 TaxID=1542965 RepID=UPI0005B700AA|nr:TadG family pilus assembly protein [Burkholderia sp. MSHR3999]KIP17971.1 tad-like Flp pilus-assembly family protein [Burkholderia sp. MSHR3999]
MSTARFPGCRPAGRDRVRMRGQRGAVSVLATVWVLVALVTLGAIDIGNLFFQRRDLQRIADLSALAAVQSLDPSDTSCGAANTAALNNARENETSNTVTTGAPARGQDQVAATCGRWDPQVYAGQPAYFAPAASGMTQLNATQVTVTRTMRYSFLGVVSMLGAGPGTMSATATARASAIDTFSISATLASVDPVWLNGILSALLGTSVSLTLADYQALAGANIKLLGISTALGAGTVNGLVDLSVTVPTLIGNLSAYVGALQAGGGNGPGYVAQLQAASTALGKLAGASVGNTTVVVANAPNALLNISLGNPQSGADAQVNLLDLLTTAAQVAAYNKGHAVSLNTGVTLPLGASGFNVVSLQLQVLNPPSIAVGEAGLLPNGTWRTQASSAQIGVYLNVQTPSIPITGALGLSGLIDLTLSGIDLPIYLLVGGPAVASLAATKCGSATTPSTTTIVATPGIAKLCISAPPSGTLNLSNVSTCPPAGTLQLLNLQASTLLSPPVSLGVSASISNPVLQIVGTASSSAPYAGYPSATPYHFCNAPAGLATPVSCGSGWVSPSTASSPNSYWTTYVNNLGASLGTALSNINLNAITILGIPIPLGPLLNAIGSLVLQPVLSALDAVLVPILGLLGVQVGQATVHQISLTCNAAQLVN